MMPVAWHETVGRSGVAGNVQGGMVEERRRRMQC